MNKVSTCPSQAEYKHKAKDFSGTRGLHEGASTQFQERLIKQGITGIKIEKEVSLENLVCVTLIVPLIRKRTGLNKLQVTLFSENTRTFIKDTTSNPLV